MFQFTAATSIGAVLLTMMAAPIGAFLHRDGRSMTAVTTDRGGLVSSVPASLSHGAFRLFAETSPESDNEKMRMFESEGWKGIAEDLRSFPLFCIATAEDNPVAYQITVGEEKTFDVPFFYCDVTEAAAALEKAQASSDNATEGVDLKLLPFPLEQAFKLWCGDKAVIIPSKASILQAGAPAGTNPIGQRVPMWACLDIAEEQGEGLPPKLPIFMGLEDANDAVLEAVGGDRAKVDDLEVVCLSLDGAIEQLVTAAPEEAPGFAFIPPSKSMKYIEENVQQ
ncbi:unnamed protein product [Pseudo-nitzschia multistriata]|uniref:Uncharacterized protein n=1 Tax=Pseudo-nitzschia multistriata TaxID=183589 RepID=A0A448ZCN8_9STRA|nr:unnamed protein product [Pseudo-nitzschia multistriata]